MEQSDYSICHFIVTVFILTLALYSMMGSSPRRPLLPHTLVCIENYLFIVGIGPIRDEQLIFIFRFIPFVHTFYEDSYKYYNINIRYTSVLEFSTMSFIYNDCCV